MNFKLAVSEAKIVAESTFKKGINLASVDEIVYMTSPHSLTGSEEVNLLKLETEF